MRFSFLSTAAPTLIFLLAGGVCGGEPPLSRIAFGSCAKQDRPQIIWDAVIQKDPELFLFIGDNIYADTDDMQVMAEKYAQLGAKPGYQRLLNQCPVWAVWDDHDYGLDDGGAEYSKKKEAKRVFLEFFKEPPQSPRWTREGIYDAKIFGPPGKRTQIIMLDTRYFRGPLRTIPKEKRKHKYDRYLPDRNPELTMLGSLQWAWLERQLKIPAELRLIVSSIQVHHRDHGTEKWYNMPLERERLYDLIRKTRSNGVILLSGNPHMAEFSSLKANHPLGVGYPLYEFTSSGLTHSWGHEVDQPNRFRIKKAFGYRNFGLIQIDWSKKDPRIRLRIFDVRGKSRVKHKLRLSRLRHPPVPK